MTNHESIQKAKVELDIARRLSDPLKIDLAEAALNDLLDRQSVTDVTGNNEEEQA